MVQGYYIWQNEHEQYEAMCLKPKLEITKNWCYIAFHYWVGADSDRASWLTGDLFKGSSRNLKERAGTNIPIHLTQKKCIQTEQPITELLVKTFKKYNII